MAKLILDRVKVTFTLRMSSAMEVKAHLKTAVLVNWEFMTATTLKMLEPSVKVCVCRAVFHRNSIHRIDPIPDFSQIHVQMVV